MPALAALDDRVGTLRLRVPADTVPGPTCRSVVRSVTMPQRGRQILVVRSLVVGATADDPARLRREVASEVDAAWRRARPPARAGDGDAVVFRDRVELLAHLLSDLADDELTRRWWWAVVGTQIAPRSATVADVLVEHPREVPAVMDELDRSRRLDAVVARLDDDGAHRVIAAVAAAFSLASAASSVTSGPTAGVPARGARPTPVPASTQSGSPQRRLVRLARLLLTDPSAARAADASAPDAGGAPEAPAAGSVRDEVDGVVDRRPSSPDGADPRPGARGDDTPPELHRDGPAHVRSGRPSDDTSEVPGVHDETRAASTIPGASTSGRVAVGTDDGARSVPDRRSSEAIQPPDADVVGEPTHRIDGDEPEPSLAAGVEMATALGGVFFLIAPLLELRVGEAFGERFESTVGWWGSLELIARSLVPLAPDVDRDPLWDVLATLDGGRSALDRVRTLRPVDLRSPNGWPSAAQDGSALPSLWHTAASGLGGVGLDWLEDARSSFVAHLCARLAVAADALVEVLRRPATIVVDRLHVDVVFPIDAALLAVRRAGFDRDPGWVPELGRVVLFHFGDRHADRGWSS